MEQIVTLVSFETKTGMGQRGPWQMWLFKDAGGNAYQTFDAALATKAQALVGQSARLQYEAMQRGQYVNNVIKAIEAAALAPAATAPNAPLGAPNAQTYIPQAAPDKEKRIHRQTASKVAADVIQVLGLEVNSLDEFVQLCDSLVSYYETGSAPGSSVPVALNGAASSDAAPVGVGADDIPFGTVAY